MPKCTYLCPGSPTPVRQGPRSPAPRCSAPSSYRLAVARSMIHLLSDVEHRICLHPKASSQKAKEEARRQKHTAPGIRWSSPTQLLVWRLLAYLWESGRDPEFSSIYGRMYPASLVSLLIPQCPELTVPHHLGVAHRASMRQHAPQPGRFPCSAGWLSLGPSAQS